jgi:rare lipoprotein A
MLPRLAEIRKIVARVDTTAGVHDFAVEADLIQQREERVVVVPVQKRDRDGGTCSATNLLRLAVAACLVGSGCAGPRPPAPAPDPGALAPGWTESGVASWYGEPFHGRRTASGEVYDMEEMTAAHRWLPFGTVVRVENRDNGREAELRITDRGPFVKDRILDVSRAGARALGMLGPGTAEVRIVLLQLPREPDCVEVQIGAYSQPTNAAAARSEAERAGYAARELDGSDGLRRVIVGPFGSVADAEAARERLGGLLRACRGAGTEQSTAVRL